MISISPIASAGEATKYYLDDEKHLNGEQPELTTEKENGESDKEKNYYLKDSNNTAWFGKLATEKGLDGKPIEGDTLQAVLSGSLLDETIHGKRDKHRAGFDLTFSAPKSVSVLALVGGDTRLLDGHNNAVKFALSELEKDAAQVKYTEEDTKKQSYANSKSMLFGLVQHKTSREDDPQLHTHALTANMTRDEQGRLRALATSLKQSGGVINGTMERVYNNQLYYGMLYQSHLSKQAESLGYTVKGAGNGQFEIEGVPQSLMDDFSKRSQQINEKTQDLGFNSQQTRDLAAKNTRKAKTHKDAVELNSTWQHTVKTDGFDITAFINNAKENPVKAPNENVIKPRAVDALTRTINHLSKTQTQLSYEKMVSFAMSEFTKGEKLDALDIKLALDKRIASKELIGLDKNNSQFTTTALLDNEKKLINSTKGRPRHMRTQPNDAAIEQLNLNKENQNKLAELFLSTKQFNTVNVFGSSEQVAKGLLHVGSESGKRIHIMTPDGVSQEKTERTVKRQSHTPLQWIKNTFRADFVHGVNQYLGDKVTPFSNKDVFVFEDSGKFSGNQLIDITNKAKHTNSKIIFLNHASARQGMKSHSSMDLLSKGNTNNINWVNNQPTKAKIKLHDNNLNELVNQYADKPDKTNTQVLATTNADVKTLNTAIRERLKQTGEVSRQGVSISTLNPHFLSQEQRTLSTHYKPDMVLRSWSEGTMSQYTVIQPHRKTNTLDIIDEKGHIYTIDPSKPAHNFSVFKKESLEIASGDKIITSGKHYASQLAAHQAFIVKKATPQSITLEDREGQQKTIKTKHLTDAPITHNFASTTQKISDTATHLMVQTKAYSASKELLNELSLNRENIDIFTDDKEKVAAQFEKNEVRPAAIERVMATTQPTEKYLSTLTTNTVTKDVEQALRLLNTPTSTNIEQAVNFAIHHISEKEAGYTQKELVMQAIRYSLEETGTAISKEDIIDTLKNNQETLSSEFSDGTRWTTKDAIHTEKTILDTLARGKNQTTPFVTHTQATEFLQHESRLTQGQKESVHMIATTPDRFVAVQGLAGTGKSTMLEKDIELIHSIDKLSNKETTILGVAPTHAAVNELKSKGVEAQTLQSLLADIQSGKTTANTYQQTLFLLDESSMIGNNDMKHFTALVEKSGAKAVLLGDKAQLQSLSAGKPFELAMSNDALNRTDMTDIVRQQNDTLLGAVHNMVDKQPESSLSKLKQQPNADTGINKTHHVVSTYEKITPNHRENQEIATEKLAHVVAQDYLSRTEQSQEDTLIIAYTNKERDTITEHIRHGLQQSNQLHKENTLMPRLRSIGATKEEMATMLPYKKGLVVKTGKDTLATIIHVDNKHNLVTVKEQSTGKERPFFPKNSDHKMTNLFTRSDQPLSTNDKVMMRMTDKDKGIEANTPYTVSNIENNLITLSNKKQHTITLSTTDLKDAHWDYSYTRTANMAQGATYKNVITAIKGRGQLTNIRRAYIDLTRASEHVKLYTDNEGTMIKQWLNNQDDKRSAIETNTLSTPKESITFNTASLPKENPHYQDINGNLDIKIMAKKLNSELAMRVESLAIHLLGAPNKSKSDRDYLTFGIGKSALKVTLTGEHRGHFKDWTTGEKGNGINLIMAVEYIGFKDALLHADTLLNQTKDSPLTLNPNHEKLTNTTPKFISELEARARQYQQEATPIKGTIAQEYLRNKGIIIDDHPSIKFHPKVYSSETRSNYPAIISTIENNKGESNAIEITYLDNKGNTADLNIEKRVLGTKTKSNIVINEGSNTNISIITTTIEDALLINQHNNKDIDINTVNNKNDIQIMDKNTLRDNIIIVLNTKGENLNENNITKIMDNFTNHTVTFIDNAELQKQIDTEITKIEHGQLEIKNEVGNNLDMHKQENAIKQEDEHLLSSQSKFIKEQERKEENELMSKVSNINMDEKSTPDIDTNTQRLMELDRER